MNRPIIILGTGRSGTTIFAEMLSKHKKLVYPTQITSRFPKKLWLTRCYLHFVKMPVIGFFLGKIVKISESYPLWDTMFRGFTNPYRNLSDKDVTPAAKKRIIMQLEKLAVNKNSRLLIKITGWPRIGFLKEVFPDAIFIHVVRDGRAVANSLMNVKFWNGWRGPGGWRLGKLTDKNLEHFKNSNGDFCALAGIYWNILIEETNRDIEKYKPQLLTIKYEDLCNDRNTEMERVLDFCELESSSRFERVIKQYKLEDKNFKWKDELNSKQQKILDDVTEMNNLKYGYKKEVDRF